MSLQLLDLSGEPSLDDVLREPAIRLLMARDGVSRNDIEKLAAERRREPSAEGDPRRVLMARLRSLVGETEGETRSIDRG